MPNPHHHLLGCPTPHLLGWPDTPPPTAANKQHLLPTEREHLALGGGQYKEKATKPCGQGGKICQDFRPQGPPGDKERPQMPATAGQPSLRATAPGPLTTQSGLELVGTWQRASWGGFQLPLSPQAGASGDSW